MKTVEVIFFLLGLLKFLQVKAGNLEDKFTYVGDGYCRNTNGNHYDYVSYINMADIENCATKSFGLISTYGTGSVVGFNYYEDENNGRCTCLFDAGKMTPVPSDAWYADTGAIAKGLPAQVVAASDSVCYKLQEQYYVTPKCNSLCTSNADCDVASDGCKSCGKFLTLFAILTV
jgi:hypothetical protein